MAKESTGFNLKVQFGTTKFCSKTKTLPNIEQDEKVDISTDCLIEGLREFLQGDLATIGDFSLGTPLDFTLAGTLTTMMLSKTTDTLTIVSDLTGEGVSIPKAFISGVDLGKGDIGSATEMTIKIGFGGGDDGKPSFTA